MNKNQLEFVMNELGFVGARRTVMEFMFFGGYSGYAAEKVAGIPKGTATRDAKKCRDKWVELQRVAKAVNKLT